jgi:predicted nucleotidyltransferase
MAKIQKIRKILQQKKPFLLKRYKIKELGIFGSYLRGMEGKGSDLDLLIDFRKSPTFLEFMEIENYLADALGIKVDLVMKSSLKPRIGQQILEEVEYL